ncbi:MAG: outer membrane beta-barrel protein [Sediminibacterium sp.]|nr:outer membrane beta-barrel protein [Sediminibacterium sp.]
MMQKSKRFLQFILVLQLGMMQVAAFGQYKPLRLTVVDAKKQPISFANMAIQKLDSPYQRNQLTDSNGIAIVLLNPGAIYQFKTVAIGYQADTRTIKFEQLSQVQIVLKETTNQLKEVVVTSTKPLIKQEDDKTVVDPEPLAASSTNAYETMEKIPGIFIDQDGNIYLNGLSPAGVQINGRELKMSASDMATILKSLPPSSIQKIELVRTPSAKYDASGGGGVVNIILKKGVKIGLNGSVNLGNNQGVYGNQFIGLTLNNTTDKYNVYLNTQYNQNDGYSIVNTDRYLSMDTVLKQTAKTLSPNKSAYIGFGLGSNWTDRFELNYDARMSGQSFVNTTNNQSLLQNIAAQQNLSAIASLVKNDGSSLNINQSVRSKLKLDSLGGEWTVDVSYNLIRANTEQDYNNTLLAGGLVSKGAGDFSNDRDFYTYQTDYKKKQFGITMEAGLKSSILTFRNNANYQKDMNGIAVKDAFRTSAYNFKEQINAAYLQGSKTWGAVILKFGTRIEQTIMQGKQRIPSDTSFSLNRTDAFPYVFLSRKLFTISGYEMRGYLVYRKTISRPSYEFLNPFPKYIDPFLYESGNPSLKPQFTSNYEANISVDDKPIFAFGVNETKDIFTNVVYQSPNNKQIAYRTYDNLGKSKETYFRGIAVIPPGKAFFAVLGAQYNHNVYNGIYEQKPIVFDKATWTFFTFQSLKLGKLSTFTINGFWRTNGQQQFYELDNFGQLNSSLNRQFLNKKLTVTLSMNDIFFTNKNTFALRQGSIYAVGLRESDSRRWGINIRYNFGIKPKEQKMDMFNSEMKVN